MGLFDGGPFDFDGDGEMDALEMMVGMQMTANSREEAIELTGDDTFYPGTDGFNDNGGDNKNRYLEK